MNKRFVVTLNFTTASGVNVTRQVALRDSFRSGAEARAKQNAVPADATNVTARAVLA